MLDPKLDPAIEKAKEINGILSGWRRRSSEKFIPLRTIMDCVGRVSGYEIIQKSGSFLSLLPANSQAASYGAMLKTEVDGENKKATIIVNSDLPAVMQRFSLVHELGHLLTVPNSAYCDASGKTYTLSTHLSPDVTFISDDKLNDEYMLAEQCANIFALMVLIPDDLKLRDLKTNRISQLAGDYGVTEDAIVSRMMLTSRVKENRTVAGTAQV